MTKSATIVSFADLQFASRPVNLELETRMHQLLLERAVEIERIQPQYWQEVQLQGVALAPTRKIVPVI